jgi:hypothetical protein
MIFYPKKIKISLKDPLKMMTKITLLCDYHHFRPDILQLILQPEIQ